MLANGHKGDKLLKGDKTSVSSNKTSTRNFRRRCTDATGRCWQWIRVGHKLAVLCQFVSDVDTRSFLGVLHARRWLCKIV